MQKNRIGLFDIYVSPLTLGGMSLGTKKKQAKEMIDIALQSGINHLDTADLYDFGMNEEIVGEAMKGRRNEVIVTTKVGNHFDRSRKTNDWFWDPSKTYIESALKESLDRLQTDYIDIYMLHGGTIDDPIDEIIETFEQLKKAGYIRTYGISSVRPNVIQAYQKKSNMDVVMMQYNMLDRRPEELLDTLYEQQISVLARGPLAKGILTSDADKLLEKKGSDGYLAYDRLSLRKTVEELANLSPSLSTLAFQYINHHPAIASIVFGASAKEQLIDNLEQFPNQALSEKTYEQIQAMTKFFPYSKHR